MSKSKRLQKYFHDHLPKIKNPIPNLQLPSSDSFSSSKKWVLSGCKHTKTLSFSVDDFSNSNSSSSSNNNNNNNNNKNDDAASLADVDRFLFENFKSLYLQDDEESNINDVNNIRGKNHDDDDQGHHKKLGSILYDSPWFKDPPPDLCGSSRFFVSPPGLSSSIMEDALTSMTTNTSSYEAGSSSSTSTLNDSSDDVPDNNKLPGECIAVLTYSPSPV
ncbi:transcription repressor OFP14-like [Quillaja saponaria]|uniref:Transcription repressor OFP14-like n=1 Tax=Quillaja saponaria TaxID=32244 RepID=A0AAD7L567_QUISA|nr:transcription repressor OFP14-like [Quillaja saponaria]